MVNKCINLAFINSYWAFSSSTILLCVLFLSRTISLTLSFNDSYVTKVDEEEEFSFVEFREFISKFINFFMENNILSLLSTTVFSIFGSLKSAVDINFCQMMMCDGNDGYKKMNNRNC